MFAYSGFHNQVLNFLPTFRAGFETRFLLLSTECKQSDIFFAHYIKQRNLVSKAVVGIGKKFDTWLQKLLCANAA